MQPVKDAVVRLTVPAVPEYLALVRMVVAGAARVDPLLDDERVDDLRVIVSEACTNAIEAMARRRGADDAAEGPGTIVVECHLTETEVEVTIADEGHGFDPGGLTALPEVTDPSRLHVERGLGIPLIRALSDRAEISTGAAGTTVRAVLSVDPPAL